MCAERTEHKPNLLLSVLSNRCPRCRRGRLYENANPYNLFRFMRMNKYCPECGQPTEPETGFYFGTGYVSYALAVAASVVTFVAWWFLFGFSLDDNSVVWWLIANGVLLVVMQPLLMRVSRSIWIAFFVYYDKNWRARKLLEA
ncbi:MAG: DUF983 domain-containing protein [Chitinophaga sp.]|jgi:uncharacterized protein (DUF983 family)